MPRNKLLIGWLIAQLVNHLGFFISEREISLVRKWTREIFRSEMTDPNESLVCALDHPITTTYLLA